MLRTTALAFSAVVLLVGFGGFAPGAVLYEYNFDGGSLLNTGTAGDGDLTPYGPGANSGNIPAFVASRTDSQGVTRTDLFDYSVGGGTRSYHFSNIANQNLAAWSVALWARANSTTPPSQYSSVFMNDDFQINNTGGTWRYRGGNTQFGTVLADTWQYIVATNDGTNTRLYVDGVLGATLGDVGSNFYEIGIGTNRARDNNGRWNGDIDDVSVLDRPLSQAEIEANYRLGTTTIIPEPSTLFIWSLLAGLGVGFGWRRRRQ
jgi:hypothetical protein